MIGLIKSFLPSVQHASTSPIHVIGIAHLSRSNCRPSWPKLTQ